MSYTIPDLDRQFAQLPDTERNKGFARLFPYYDNVRRFNGSPTISQFLNNPNLNKILEYCSYNHDVSNIPNNLECLKDDVTNFFGNMYATVDNEKLRKNLFTHFLMRECNKKTIPISDTAIANIYSSIFGEKMSQKIITMVSNYCGLYYTLKSPYEYLVDTDNFDDLFGEEDSGDVEDSEDTDTMEEDTIYEFLNPKGMEKVISATNLKKVLLYIAHKNFKQKPFSTKDITTAVCDEYGIEENVWGDYLNYKKSALRERISSSMYKLRLDKLVKKSANRTNTVTPKGARKVKQYKLDFEDSKLLVLKDKSLVFDDKKKDQIKQIAFSIEKTWDKNNNHLADIILQSHYELNVDTSTEFSVEINFGVLCNYICQAYCVDENIWGQYLNHNRTMFRKQVSNFKGKLIKKGFLEKTGTTKSTITQAGVVFVESWLDTEEFEIDTDKKIVATVPPTEEYMQMIIERENSLDEDETQTTEETVVEEDFSDNKTFTADVEQTTVDVEQTEDMLILRMVSNETAIENEVVEDENYDEYLRKVLSENDTLTEKVKDLKATVDTFVGFLKEKDLLSEYIVSISKGTNIPF